MFKKVTIPEKWVDRFHVDRIAENRYRLKLISIIFLVVGIVVSIQHQINPGGGVKNTVLFYYYRYVFIAIITAGSTGLLVISLVKKLRTTAQSLVYGTLLLVYLTICMFLNLVDLLHTEELVAFFVPLMVTDALSKTSFKAILSVHIYCYALVSIGIIFFPPHLETFKHAYLLIYMMIGLMIWWSQDRVWRMGFLTRMELEQEIREKELAEEKLMSAQKLLIENAHKAGMAQVAADTLHNVGNILNSLKTSTQLIKHTLDSNPADDYSQACELLKENIGVIEKFIKEDPRGRKLLSYFLILDKEFQNTFQTIKENVDRLDQKTNNISDVVTAQQSFVGSLATVEPVNLATSIEDSLLLVPELLNEKQYQVVRNYTEIPDIPLSKTKLLHAFVNLFKNALHALYDSKSNPKRLEITIKKLNSSILVKVSDNGHGIARENLLKVFSHGFTTKKNGKGFGLHSCALYLQEMGANISVDSPGINQGTTFTLTFPLDKR